MKMILPLFLLIVTRLAAQDDGCSKCEMLREECEYSVSPRKEEVCAFFRQECLQTDTMYVSEQGQTATPATAEAIRVVATSKCIDFKEVKEIEKKSNREVRSFQVSKNDTVYSVAETAPEFTGGDEALLKYFSSSVRYPATAREKKITGTVYVKCVIRKNGAVTSVKAVRGPSPDLNAEAVRAVKAMPAWKPASYKKQPVSMYAVIPVRFALK
jgi:TonB family protein